MINKLILIGLTVSLLVSSCGNSASDQLGQTVAELGINMENGDGVILISQTDCTTCIYDRLENLVANGCHKAIVVRHPGVTLKVRDPKILALFNQCGSYDYINNHDILAKLADITGANQGPYRISMEAGKYTCEVL